MLKLPPSPSQSTRANEIMITSRSPAYHPPLPAGAPPPQRPPPPTATAGSTPPVHSAPSTPVHHYTTTSTSSPEIGMISTTSSFDSVRSYSPRVSGTSTTSLFKRPPTSGNRRPLPPPTTASATTSTTRPSRSTTSTTRTDAATSQGRRVDDPRRTSSRSPSPNRFKLPPESPRARVVSSSEITANRGGASPVPSPSSSHRFKLPPDSPRSSPAAAVSRGTARLGGHVESPQVSPSCTVQSHLLVPNLATSSTAPLANDQVTKVESIPGPNTTTPVLQPPPSSPMTLLPRRDEPLIMKQDGGTSNRLEASQWNATSTAAATESTANDATGEEVPAITSMIVTTTVEPVSSTIVSKLPEGWDELNDPASGQVYYYHAQLHITQWERPVEDTHATTPPAVLPPSVESELAASTVPSHAPPTVADTTTFEEEYPPSLDHFQPIADSSLYEEGDQHNPSTAPDTTLPSEMPVEHETVTTLSDNLQSQVTAEETALTTPETTTTPATEEEDSSLPDGWIELVDPSSGLIYYYHVGDNITTWDKPQTTKETPTLSVEPKLNEATEGGGGLDAATEQHVEEAGIEGSMEWPVTDTDNTVAVEPQLVVSGSEPHETTVPVSTSDVPDGWQECVDPNSGQVYYYHTLTNVTTWERPVQDAAPVPLLGDDDPDTIDERPPDEVDDDFGLRDDYLRHINEPKSSDINEVEEDGQRMDDDHVVENANAPDEIPTTDDGDENAPYLQATATSPESDKLPEGWVEAIDETTGQTYFFHEVDGITTWDRPVAEAVEVAVPEQDTVSAEEGEGCEAAAVAQDALPDGWEEIYDDSTGLTFYFHAQDNATTWERPTVLTHSHTDNGESLEVDQRQSQENDVVDTLNNESDNLLEGGVESLDQPASKSHNALPEGWEEVDDPRSGLVYYYHAGDDITTWERPVASNMERRESTSESAVSGAALHGEVTQPETNASHDQTVDSPEVQLTFSTEKIVSASDLGQEESALPDGWEQLYDESSGSVYYFHAATDTAMWDRPTDDGRAAQASLTEEPSLVSPDRPEVKGEAAVISDVDPSEGHEIQTSLLHEMVDYPLGERSDQFESIASDQGEERRETGLLDEAPKDDSFPTLPDGWQAVFDPASEMYYFVNENEGITTWDRPRTEAEEPSLENVVQPDASELPASSQPTGEVLRNGWERLVDEDSGEVYYYHAGTDISTSEFPVEAANDFPDSVVAPEMEHEQALEQEDAPELQVEDHVFDSESSLQNETESDLPPGWEEVVDDITGQVYYYCEAQQISSWDRPVAVSTAAGAHIDLMSPSDEAGLVEPAPEETAAAPSSMTSLPDGWAQVALPDSGLSLDDEVGASDIHPPAGEHDAHLNAAPSKSGLSDDWVEVTDTQDRSDSANDQAGSDVHPEWTEPGESKTGDERDEMGVTKLPPGWIELIDPGSLRPYYFNEQSNETAWDRPSTDYSLETKASSQEPTLVCEQHEESLPEGWDEVSDPSSGSVYYCNAATGETTWDRPAVSTYPTAKARSTRFEKQERRSHAIATFGFGGRLCVLTCSNESCSRIVVTRTCHIASDNPIVEIQSKRLQASVSGALAYSDANSVLSYLKQRSKSPGDLWQLLSIAAHTKGRLRSERPVGDPKSPESAILALLAQAANDSKDDREILAVSSNSSPDASRIQSLFVQGKRAEAAREAFSHGSFALSLLIASICGPDLYQEAVANFAQAGLVPGSPMYTAAMLFSAQVAPERSIWGEDSERIRRTWKEHLSAILNVRSNGWDRFAVSLGDILKEMNEIEAAHFCYVACGCSIASPARKDSRLTLIGCDISSKDLGLSTEQSVCAFEMTEVYEWARLQGTKNASIECLQPFKLVYAMLLADYGFEEAAATYVRNIKAFLEGRVTTGGRTLGPLSLAMLSCDWDSLSAFLVEFESRLMKQTAASSTLSSPHDEKSAHRRGVTEIGPAKADPPSLSYTPRNGATTVEYETLPRLHEEEQVYGRLPAGPPRVDTAENELIRKDYSAATENSPLQLGLSTPRRLDNVPEAGYASTQGPTTTPMAQDSSYRPPMQTPVPAMDTPSDASQKSSKPRSAPMSAPANLQQSTSTPSSSSKKNGFFSSIGVRIAKILTPNATQADLGEGMQAYFDEKRKVWVFPGEDPDEVAKPIGPPPTTPQANLNATQTPAALASSATPSVSVANDPLAAMMAPPKRAPASFQNKSKSLGAAASSSPPRHMPAIPGMVLPSGIPGASGTTASAGPPPNFAVFMPSPSATTAASS